MLFYISLKLFPKETDKVTRYTGGEKMMNPQKSTAEKKKHWLFQDVFHHFLFLSFSTSRQPYIIKKADKSEQLYSSLTTEGTILIQWKNKVKIFSNLNVVPQMFVDGLWDWKMFWIDFLIYISFKTFYYNGWNKLKQRVKKKGIRCWSYY